MKLEQQTRREFCAHSGRAVCATALGTALVSVLQGCGGGGGPTSASGGPSAGGSAGAAPDLPVLNTTAAGGVATLTIGTGSPLAAVGGAALVQASGGGVFLVARTAADAFVALTATCTHEACTINGFANQRYVCPCHGSTFDTSGRVLVGPAVASLRQFTTRFANNVLTINL